MPGQREIKTAVRRTQLAGQSQGLGLQQPRRVPQTLL